MRRFGGVCRTFAAIVIGFITAGPVYGDTWVKAESEHFIVYSNVNATATEAYTRNLEKYRYVIGAFYRRANEEELADPKLTLYFVKSPDDFRKIWPDMPGSVYGFVRICSNGLAGYSLYDGDRIRTAGKIQNQTENVSQTVLFHEYAHLFMFQNSQVAYPRWFVEGFAEYYGTTKIQDNEAVIGMAWSDRVWGLDDQGSLKWEDLLRDAPSTRRANAANDFYSQSWLLTHWILFDPQRTAAFSTFLDARNKGVDGVEAFEKAFGVPVKTLNRVLNTYLRSLKATLYSIKGMPDPQITLSTLPASADKLMMWDSGVTACLAESHEDKVLDSIRKEAAKYPGDAYAQSVLARVEIVLGDEEKALDYYKAQTAANPKDAEAFFRLGQTWFLMTAHDKYAPGETRESQMKKARLMLNKAYQLDPLNAVNLYYFSLTGTPGPNFPDESTLNAAYEAHLMAPSVQEYALHAANLLIQKERFVEARRALMPLANNPHGGALSQWVTSLVTAIKAGKSRDELLELMRTPVKTDDDVKPGGDDDKSQEGKTK